MLIENSYRNDQEFRNFIDEYLRGKPRRPFRFVDLPLEVKLEIARIAMKSNDTLGFDHVNSKLSGVKKLVALSQTCKQLRAQLSGTVWEVNRIMFRTLLPAFSVGLRTQLKDMQTALKSFSDTVQPENLHHPSVYVKREFAVGVTWLLIENFDYIDKLVETVPSSQWSVCFGDWNITFENNAVNHNVKNFKAIGAKLSAALDEHYADDRTRNWRVWPEVYEGSRQEAKELMEASGEVEAAGWITGGL